MINRKTIVSLALIVLTAALCYVNSVGGGFTFDDVYMVENNLLIRSLGNAGKIFATPWWWGGTSQVSHEYRPLTVLSFALNYRFHGLSPIGYRISNVLLHVFACVMFYLFLWIWHGERRLPLISALFFAAHPVHTEAVNNIVGRAEILAALFAFTGLFFYVAGSGRRNAVLYYFASAIFFFLGLLSKETAIVFFPAVLLIFILDMKREKRGSFWDALRKSRNMAPLLAFLFVLTFYLILRKSALGGIAGSSARISPLDNILTVAKENREVLSYYATSIKALGIYFYLLLAPLSLTADYSYKEIPLSRGMFEIEVFVSLIALLTLCFFVIILWRKNLRYPLFGVMFLLFALAPVSNIFRMIGTLLGERLLYIPSAGFCMVLAWILDRLSARLARDTGLQRLRISPKTILGVLCALLIIVYGIRCLTRNPAWKDNLTLFEITSRTSPLCARAHRNLGHELMLRGEYGKAIKSLERAIQIAPFYAAAWASKGETLRRMSKPDKSIGFQKKALSLQPGFYLAHFYMAEAMFDLGEMKGDRALFKKAAEAYKTSARLLPTIAPPWIRLGDIYRESLHDPEKAEYCYQKARAIAPESPLPLIGLGRLFIQEGNFEKAKRFLLIAEKLAPRNVQSAFYQGVAALEEKNYTETERCFLKVIDLAPDDPYSYLNLADLYYDELDQPSKALIYYEEYLRRFPRGLRRAEVEKTLETLK